MSYVHVPPRVLKRTQACINTEMANVTFTTSAEFLNLLQFAESFAMLEPKFSQQLAIIVWDLSLRAG